MFVETIQIRTVIKCKDNSIESTYDLMSIKVDSEITLYFPWNVYKVISISDVRFVKHDNENVRFVHVTRIPKNEPKLINYEMSA